MVTGAGLIGERGGVIDNDSHKKMRSFFVGRRGAGSPRPAPTTIPRAAAMVDRWVRGWAGLGGETPPLRGWGGELLQDGLGEGVVGEVGGAIGFEDSLHKDTEIFLNSLGFGMVLTEFF